MSIRARLTAWVALSAVLVVGLAGGLLIRQQSNQAFFDARVTATVLLETLALPAAMALAVNDIEGLDDNMTELARVGRARMNVLTLQMYDHRGRLVTNTIGQTLVQSPTHDAPRPKPDFVANALRSEQPIWRQSRHNNGALILEVSMPSVSGIRWGTLCGTFDLSEVEKAWINNQRLLLIVIALFGCTLVLSLYAGLSRIVIRPITNLARAAARIQNRDFTARAPVVSNDELGRLAAGFNDMTAELESYTSDLERKVTERTQQVRAKNAELERTNQRLKEVVEELDRLAKIDVLTGAYNRRHFQEFLEFEVKRGRRSRHDFCMVMIDLDRFKTINDTYGHPSGDAVLKKVADLVQEQIRTTDLMARIGGEEFVVLFLDSDREAGVQAGEKLREAIERHSFLDIDGGLLPKVTISLGLAYFPSDALDPESLLAKADQALYASKRNGRNQLTTWTEQIGAEAAELSGRFRAIP